MVADPARIEATREWLGKVAIDLRSAEIVLAAQPPVLEDALFHCQQAVEKALKAFLAWHDRPFRKTHDLRDLREKCCDIDHTLAGSLAPVTALTDYAWMFRYPGAAIRPTAEEAEAALGTARDVVTAILTRLPAEVQP